MERFKKGGGMSYCLNTGGKNIHGFDKLKQTHLNEKQRRPFVMTEDMLDALLQGHVCRLDLPVTVNLSDNQEHLTLTTGTELFIALSDEAIQRFNS
jgi:hypothetical protein